MVGLPHPGTGVDAGGLSEAEPGGGRQVLAKLRGEAAVFTASLLVGEWRPRQEKAASSRLQAVARRL